MENKKTRALNYSETLDELLGVKKTLSPVSVRKDSDFNRMVGLLNNFPHPERPPTRHGNRILADSPKNTSLGQGDKKEAEYSNSNSSTSTSVPTSSETTSDTTPIKEDDQSISSESTTNHNSKIGGLSKVAGNSSFKIQLFNLEHNEKTFQKGKTSSKISENDGKGKRTERSRSATTHNRNMKLQTDNSKNVIVSISHTLNGSNAYKAWLKEKHAEDLKKKLLLKGKGELERKKEEEKKKDAEKAFESWKKRKDKIIIDCKSKEIEKRKKEEQNRLEIKEKSKNDSKKLFDAWKKQKIKQSIENEKMRRMKEEEVIKKIEEKKEQQENNRKAFLAWCAKDKEKKLEAARKALESRRSLETQRRNEKEYRDALAKEAYDVWLEMKEKKWRFENSLKGRILRFEAETMKRAPIPWIPPSNIVPRRFVTSRRRTNSAMRMKTAFSTTITPAKRSISTFSVRSYLKN